MTREGAVQVVKLEKLGVPGAAACCAGCEALLRKLTKKTRLARFSGSPGAQPPMALSSGMQFRASVSST